MRCCDHVHIISTISDRKGDLIRELIADHLNDISLLFRRYSAGKDDVDFDPNVKKLIFKCIVRKDYTEGIPANNDRELEIVGSVFPLNLCYTIS